MTAVETYAITVARLSAGATATSATGEVISLSAAIDQTVQLARSLVPTHNRMFFIGNGGSAGIASHMAIDFMKNGRIPATALTDPAALTCLGNDLGFENIFSAQLEAHARPGDVLVAISSSGKSPDILRAVAAARAAGARVVTLTGFDEHNPLRSLGDINIFVASDRYGFVEVAHQMLLHAILDMHLGWAAERTSEPPRRPSYVPIGIA